MKQEKLFDLLKAAVSPCECVKAAKQELLENGFEEIDYTGDWKLVRGGRYVLNHHDTTMFAFTVGSGYNKKDMANSTMSPFESSGYSHSALLLAYNQIAVDLVRLQEDS
jgi:aspartyl aminopeptidase